MNSFTHTESRSVDGKPTIDAIRIEWAQDCDMVPTFVDDEGEEYREENQKRLDAYHRGEWSYRGCQARATVSYRMNQHSGDRRLEWFTSGGLFGIESDCGADYESEVQKDELTDLKEHLETFGVDTSDFWQKVSEGTTKEEGVTHQGITLPTAAPTVGALIGA